MMKNNRFKLVGFLHIKNRTQTLKLRVYIFLSALTFQDAANELENRVHYKRLCQKSYTRISRNISFSRHPLSSQRSRLVFIYISTSSATALKRRLSLINVFA